jgi:hypothetical protein
MTKQKIFHNIDLRSFELRGQSYKTFYGHNLQVFVKARVFVLDKPFQPSLMFVCKARSLPRVEHLKGVSLGYAPALPANIRLGWKGLPG